MNLSILEVRHLRTLVALRDSARLVLGQGGQMRIAVECHTCFDWLMPAMDAFRTRWPEVELDIVSGFQRLLEHAQQLRQTLQATPDSDSERWLLALLAHCDDLHNELSLFCLPPLDAAEQPAQATWQQLSQLDSLQWPAASQAQVQQVQRYANERIAMAKRLDELAASLAQMDFRFLYDAQRDLFSIGYNAEENRLDSACYDLLASEARLTNFVVIAQGQLP